MGLETATYVGDLNTSNPVGSTDAKSQGDDHLRLIKATLQNTFPGMTGRAWRSQTKGGNYTVLGTDNLTWLNCTATLTLDLTAAATLGNGHQFIVHANGGTVTIDPSGAETINGGTTLAIGNGQAVLVSCNGTSFTAVALDLHYGALSPAQITGNQNDYSPTGLTTARRLRINSDARRNITGLALGADGKEMVIHNVGTFPIVFTYEDAASTAANRFAFGCTLGGGQTLRMEYDGTSSRWRGVVIPEALGTVKDMAGGTLEAGYLAIDQNVSRTTYASLFNVIGTTWGVGDGSTTFGLFVGAGRALVAAGTGTVIENSTASSGNGWTVPSNNKKWITGMPVVLSNLTGFTTSASAGPTYYVVRISATNIRLATTLVLAQKLTPDVTVSGTGTVTFTHTFQTRTTGELGGEQAHAPAVGEESPHTHTTDSQGTHSHNETYFAGVSSGGTPTQPAGTDGGGNVAAFADDAAGAHTHTALAAAADVAANIEGPFAVVTRGIRYC